MDIFIGLVYANKVGGKGKIYMKVKKIKVLFVGLLWIFFLGTIGLSLIINGLDKVKETDTVDLPVTIRYIKLEEWSGNSRYIIIDTYEYDHPFRVHGEFDNCLKSNKMRQGNKVYLKIKKSDEEVFVSIDDYNQCIHESIVPTRIAAIVASFGIFIGAVLMTVSLVKDLKRQQKKALDR